MIAKFSHCAATLKQNGYSITAVRKLVFDTLSHHHPITMKQLAELCSPVADRASIYRTVALFESLHIIRRVHSGWKYRIELSDMYAHHHHHITCSSCGMVSLLADSPALEANIVSAAQQAGFSITTHQLEVHGLCASCQTKPQ